MLLITLKCTVMCVCMHPHPLLLSAMSCKIIYGDFHTLALFEFTQDACQQIKVKGIRVVKVIVVTGSQSLLFCGQDLRIGAMTIKTILYSKFATVSSNKSKTLSPFLSFWLLLGNININIM